MVKILSFSLFYRTSSHLIFYLQSCYAAVFNFRLITPATQQWISTSLEKEGWIKETVTATWRKKRKSGPNLPRSLISSAFLRLFVFNSVICYQQSRTNIFWSGRHLSSRTKFPPAHALQFHTVKTAAVQAMLCARTVKLYMVRRKQDHSRAKSQAGSNWRQRHTRSK